MQQLLPQRPVPGRPAHQEALGSGDRRGGPGPPEMLGLRGLRRRRADAQALRAGVSEAALTTYRATSGTLLDRELYRAAGLSGAWLGAGRGTGGRGAVGADVREGATALSAIHRHLSGSCRLLAPRASLKAGRPTGSCRPWIAPHAWQRVPDEDHVAQARLSSWEHPR
jgi:hypothetical protein